MKYWLIHIWLLYLTLQGAVLHAQNKPASPIQNIINSITLRADSQAVEKVYLHTDRSSYSAGDTIWFKAYLFKAAYLTASAKSGIVYTEIVNDQNVVIKRVMVSMYFGLGWGNIALNEKEFPQ